MSETVKEASVSDRNDSTAREESCVDDRERKRCVVAADQFKADGTQLFPAGDRCAVFIEVLIFFFRIIIFQNMSIHMERGKCRKRKLRNAECIKGTLRQSRWFINNFTLVIGIEIISTSCQKADIYRILVIWSVYFQYSGKTEKKRRKALQNM